MKLAVTVLAASLAALAAPATAQASSSFCTPVEATWTGSVPAYEGRIKACMKAHASELSAAALTR